MSRGLYYNDWEIDKVYETSSRTVTEADIAIFAGLSGDYNPLHTDAVFAESTPYKTRIAHGALIFAITTGLWDHSGWADGTAVGLLGVNVKFPAPTRAGDTIHVKLVPIEKRLTKNPSRGIVKMQLQVINQEGTIVSEQIWDYMCKAQ